MSSHVLGSYPAIGLAYSSYVPAFLDAHPDAVDFVEMPFEVLNSNPSSIEVQRRKPLVLHCASLSLAGFKPPPLRTVESVKHWVEKTETPWLGEHLAFVTADRGPAGETAATADPYDVGYSVNPPANAETLETVLRAVSDYSARLQIPVLIENSPVYFEPPGSTMSQIDILREICDQSSACLLLDLTHLYITSETLGLDPFKALCSLPIDRIVEVHVSGVDRRDGVYWDDHTRPAPDVVYDLLSLVLAGSSLKAITLEYNWSVHFPRATLLREIHRTREAVARGSLASV